MGKRRFPITGGSCHEDVEQGKSRDDLIEAGRGLKRAKMRESKGSGLGVKASTQAWKARRGKA